MQLKMVLQDIIAYMYKVIRELWRFSVLPQTQASTEVPICKEFYHFVACEFRYAGMYNLQMQRRAGFVCMR